MKSHLLQQQAVCAVLLFSHFLSVITHFSRFLFWSFSSRMRFMSHNWSATKQHLHPQSVAEINRHSVLSGDRIRQCETSSGSRHKDTRSVSVSRHFLLQAPQCPCSVRKRFSRDNCCRGRSKPGCRIVGSHTRWEWVQLHIDLTSVSRAWPDWGAVLCCWIAKRQSRWPQSVGAGAPGGTG